MTENLSAPASADRPEDSSRSCRNSNRSLERFRPQLRSERKPHRANSTPELKRSRPSRNRSSRKNLRSSLNWNSQPKLKTIANFSFALPPDRSWIGTRDRASRADCSRHAPGRRIDCGPSRNRARRKQPLKTSISRNRPMTCRLSSTRSPPPPRFPRIAIYLREPPNDCIQLLMISIGSGNTIVVFFSTPISVNVWR